MTRSLLFVAFMAGCSESKDAFESPSTAEDMATSADTGRWASGAEDAASDVEPHHWLMSGFLMVEEGTVDVRLSSLRALVEDIDGGFICRQGASITSAVRLVNVPDPDADIWWDVSISQNTADDCSEMGVSNPFPLTLGLGLGPMHGEIEAVLGSEAGDAPEEGFTAKSVLASIGDEGLVWVFGVATVNDFDDSSTLSGDFDQTRNVDGKWKFTALYPFPYNQ